MIVFVFPPSAPKNVPAEEAPSTSQYTRSFHASEDRDNVDATNAAKPDSNTLIVNDVTGKPAMSPSVKLQTWVDHDKFDWIAFKKTSDGLLVEQIWCSVCREEYGQDSCARKEVYGQVQVTDFDAYVTGTKKKDTVRSHHTSKSHKKAAERKSARENPGRLVQQLKKIDDAAQYHMEKLFNWAYVVAKSELPFTIVHILVETEAKNGSDMGTRYRNDKACHEFICSIGDVLKNDLIPLFQSSKPFYYSLLFDGSTDKSLSEKEVISIKVLEDGEPKFKLLG